MKILHSLQTKLTASFVVLILVVSSLTLLVTFREARLALKEVTQAELLGFSAVIAGQLSGVDADSMQVLRAGDEGSATFIRLRDRLRNIKEAHPDIKYLYTMKKGADGVFFMVDADYGNAADPGAGIGEPYKGMKGKLLQGFDRPAVDDEFTTDKWGTSLSSYTPLRDSKGALVGLVGVDMGRDMVIEKQTFIGYTIYAIMGVGILLAGFFILLFSKTIIADIHKLNRLANDISMGNMEVVMDVERRDEIGELAESFGRMVASLKIMMMMEQDQRPPED